MKTPSALIAVSLALAANVAAFWRMPCRSQTGIARIDPLVDRGDISAHVHTITGGGGFGMDADYSSLNSSGCTACEVTQDKSAYWAPTLNFQYKNGTTVMVEQTGGMLAYYLTYLDNITAFPEGFAMIAGNPNYRNFSGPFPDEPLSSWPTDPTDQFWLGQRALGYNCLNYNKDPEPSLYRHVLPHKDYLDANCVDGLRLELGFPSCGNGQVDSETHTTHVAYPSLVKEGNCPEGYDTHYPFLFFETIYNTYAFQGEDGVFLLSPGDPIGTGYHGDFIMGWHSTDFLQSALDTCTDLSGEISACPLFDIQTDAEAAKCTFDMPDVLKHDDPIGPRDGLAVDVPVQWGPDQATPYKVAGANGVPTTTGAATTATPPASYTEIPDLSYSAANATETSSAEGGIIVALESSRTSASPASEPASTDTQQAQSGYVSTVVATITSPANQPSAETPPPPPVSQDPAASGPAEPIATSYVTQGNVVEEIVEDEVKVVTVQTSIIYVTATAGPGQENGRGQSRKRHLQRHAHAHRAGR